MTSLPLGPDQFTGIKGPAVLLEPKHNPIINDLMAKYLAEGIVGCDHDAFIKMMRSPGRRLPQMIDNQTSHIALESEDNQHENYTSLESGHIAELGRRQTPSWKVPR